MTLDPPCLDVPVDLPPPMGASPRTGSGEVVRVAAFSCKGIEDLSRALGFPVAVVAAVPDPDRHRRRLADLWYASGTPMSHADWFEPFDFDEWHHRNWWRVRVDPRWFGGRPHPLAACVDDGDLALTLPAGVAREAFADAFRDGLAPLRFEAVAREPARCVRRHHSHRRVAVTSRYARSSAADPTPTEVRDLVHLEARTFPRVADVALAALRSAAAAALGTRPERAR